MGILCVQYSLKDSLLEDEMMEFQARVVVAQCNPLESLRERKYSRRSQVPFACWYGERLSLITQHYFPIEVILLRPPVYTKKCGTQCLLC